MIPHKITPASSRGVDYDGFRTGIYSERKFDDTIGDVKIFDYALEHDQLVST